MATPYTYTSSIDYINNLLFDYVETWSFQRGKAFEENEELLRAEYDKLRVRKEKRNNLSPDEERRFEELQALVGTVPYIVMDDGSFHPSAQKIKTFRQNDPMIARIRRMLQTDIVEVPRWMCGPVYRDALVFYDEDGQIVSTLNICLECQYMETSGFNHIEGDYVTYDLLKRFFIEIGHEVEEPDNFPLDEINKLKYKYRK